MSKPCCVTTAVVIALSPLLAPGCATSPMDAGGRGVPTPFGGNAHAIPGLIEAEHFDDGGPGVAYSDVDEVNHGAPYRGVTHVDTEQRADASNGYGIGWSRAGEWLAYTVDVQSNGTYTIEIPVASQKEGGVFHLDIAGKDVTGPIRIPDTGAWTKLATLHVKNVRLEKGVYVMRLIMDINGASGGIGDVDYLKFSLER